MTDDIARKVYVYFIPDIYYHRRYCAGMRIAALYISLTDILFARKELLPLTFSIPMTTETEREMGTPLFVQLTVMARSDGANKGIVETSKES
ncbi:hypothetical protein DFQ29_007990 [Apophysomyces sp. BC1021]|nr:hypothetical protein DFQ29_007990 [Apophysomyces sp. BC1021]